MRRNTTLTPPPLLARAIPAELHALPQWVGWRHRERNGKWTKEPVNVYTGQVGGVTGQVTWSSFDEAVAGMEADRYDGVGFVFTESDPYVGIDLDGCRDPETGTVESWAAEIIERFDNYTEISPSGRGVHIIVACTQPLPKGNKKPAMGIEVYQARRFFTLTGWSVDEERQRATVTDRTEDLLTWHAEVFGQSDPEPFALGKVQRPSLSVSDQEVLDRAFASSKHGSRIRALYAGDTRATTPAHRRRT
ncbi:MAG: hypothetical protein M3R02_26380 [Chloroflexota bacterium]|nr:hypothetical protein [Chloroflexota bacterium]